MKASRRSKIVVEIQIDQDNVPGWGYQIQDHIDMVMRNLESITANTHYNAEVNLVSSETLEIGKNVFESLLELHSELRKDNKVKSVDDYPGIILNQTLLKNLIDGKMAYKEGLIFPVVPGNEEFEHLNGIKIPEEKDKVDLKETYFFLPTEQAEKIIIEVK